MIQTDFSFSDNTFSTSSDINKVFQDVKKDVELPKLGFTALVEDIELINKIEIYKKQLKFNLERIVLVGLGGSSLGPKTIVDALHSNENIKVNILDNIDPDEIYNLNQKLNHSRSLFLIVTKSGTTPETIATYLYLKEQVLQKNLKLADHFVFITDPEKGYLREIATTENIPSFPIPENVGGRFSVLSSVGLVLATLLNISVNELLNGAKNILQEFCNQELELNSVCNFALTQYKLYLKGKDISVIMPYSSRLKTFGDWYAQLLAESLGKEYDNQKNTVNVGLTPLPAKGVSDQHSLLQLFKEGPNNKLIIFINILKHNQTVLIPDILPHNHPLGYLAGKSFNKLLEAEFTATRQSLAESNRPSITLTIDEINEYSLGQLFMFFELVTTCLGNFFNIDTFNQPGVERGKILTKEIMLKN